MRHLFTVHLAPQSKLPTVCQLFNKTLNSSPYKVINEIMNYYIVHIPSLICELHLANSYTLILCRVQHHMFSNKVGISQLNELTKVRNSSTFVLSTLFIGISYGARKSMKYSNYSFIKLIKTHLRNNLLNIKFKSKTQIAFSTNNNLSCWHISSSNAYSLQLYGDVPNQLYLPT